MQDMAEYLMINIIENISNHVVGIKEVLKQMILMSLYLTSMKKQILIC